MQSEHPPPTCHVYSRQTATHVLLPKELPGLLLLHPTSSKCSSPSTQTSTNPPNLGHHQTQLLTYSCPLHGWQNGAEHLPRGHDRRMTLLLSQAGPTVCCFPVHLHYFLCMCMCICMCMWAHTMNLRDSVCACIHVGKHPVDTSIVLEIEFLYRGTQSYSLNTL